MKLKKASAILGLLAVIAGLIHIGYTVYAYHAFYYNPVLKYATAIPFMVLVCLHAVLGMTNLFFLKDGTRLDLYPKQNIGTILQRITAALIFPMLILHVNTYDLLSSSSKGGHWFFFSLVMISQPLFYGIIFTHIGLSVSRALITLGLLSTPEKKKTVDKIVFVLCVIFFAVTAYVVLKVELAMFLGSGGAA